MKDLTRQILSLLLISSLLIGVMGLNLHHHICGVTGSHYVSLNDVHCSDSFHCCTAEPSETSDCCESEAPENEDYVSEDQTSCRNYIQTIELRINTLTDTAKKLIKKAVAVIVVLFHIDEEKDNNNKDHYITSDSFQIIKIPIQKIISYIHISARSAYSA